MCGDSESPPGLEVKPTALGLSGDVNLQVGSPGQALALGLVPRGGGGGPALLLLGLCCLGQVACPPWATAESLAKGRRRLALDFNQLVGSKRCDPV